MAFATPADLPNYCDISVIRELVFDGNPQVNAQDVLASPIVQNGLDAGAGQILAALQFGARYSEQDLLSLSAPSAEYLSSINCKLAMITFMGRRPGAYEREREFLKNETSELLGALKDGKEVLTLASQIEAGLADNEDTSNDDTIVTNHSLIGTRLRGHLFTYR